MATTPEGTVKKMTKILLDKHAPGLWYFMVVPGGFGVSGIPDFVCVYRGWFFAIETKAPGLRNRANAGLSALQVRAKNCIEAAGGKYFVVDDSESLKEVSTWLLRLI